MSTEPDSLILLFFFPSLPDVTCDCGSTIKTTDLSKEKRQGEQKKMMTRVRQPRRRCRGTFETTKRRENEKKAQSNAKRTNLFFFRLCRERACTLPSVCVLFVRHFSLWHSHQQQGYQVRMIVYIRMCTRYYVYTK